MRSLKRLEGLLKITEKGEMYSPAIVPNGFPLTQ